MKILYITYWGLLEQLGQSLVLPAVLNISGKGAKITLITFEKPQDLSNIEAVKLHKEILKNANINWIPLKYHKTPKLPATAFDIFHGIAKSILKRISGKFDIVHARTFLGGIIGLFVAPLVGAKFVYHNEGFYPDEQFDGGIWTKDSKIYALAKSLENKMYSKADGIICLSKRAKSVIEELPRVQENNTPVIVVPSCVDLERFAPPNRIKQSSTESIKFVYIGSVGARYTLDRLARFVKVASEINPKVTLQIYSKADSNLIKKMLKEGDLPTDKWKLASISYVEMPNALTNFDVGLFFLTQGISEHGCSPTKIGEYWASGIPVVSTKNVSDTDEIIMKDKVGVIINSHSDEEYARAFRELEDLLTDQNLSFRCRKAAESNYALETSCERQFNLYKKLSN